MIKVFDSEFERILTDDHAGHVGHEQFFLVCELQHGLFNYFHGVDGNFRNDGWNVY